MLVESLIYLSSKYSSPGLFASITTNKEAKTTLLPTSHSKGGGVVRLGMYARSALRTSRMSRATSAPFGNSWETGMDMLIRTIFLFTVRLSQGVEFPKNSVSLVERMQMQPSCGTRSRFSFMCLTR